MKKRAGSVFERNSLFWKIYAAMLFALLFPLLLFSVSRYFDERSRERTSGIDVMAKIHRWSVALLAEQADELPDDALPAWLAAMERDSGMLLRVVRSGTTFRADESEDHVSPSAGGPSFEAESASGRTRVVSTLHPPRQPPGSPLVRYIGILTVAIGGIVLSFLIVRSFMAPIAVLRRLTSQLAEGDLAVRVGPEVTDRGGEIGDLGRSFNWMAERVENLVTSQKRLLIDIPHEIRSPLQRMDVALTLARGNPGGDVEPYFDRVELEIERINEMVDELLSLTREEAAPPKNGPVRIDEVLQAIVDDAEFEGQLHDKAVEAEIDPLVVRGDTPLLKRAVGNVVYNAIRYTPSGAGIHIAAQKDGAFAVLTVSDSGHGVPEEELEKIFLPYYRTDVARERPQGGTGLGLSITRRLVENHGGTVAAANIPAGGLCVTIRLPLFFPDYFNSASFSL